VIKLHDKLFKPFLKEEEIQLAIKRIAAEIARDYKDEVPIFVGVLNGAFMFISDLLKYYPYPCEVSFVKFNFLDSALKNGTFKILKYKPLFQGRLTHFRPF